MFGVSKIKKKKIFRKSLLYPPVLYLFEQKYSKISNIVK